LRKYVKEWKIKNKEIRMKKIMRQHLQKDRRLRTKRLKERDYEKIYRKGKKIKNIEIER